MLVHPAFPIGERNLLKGNDPDAGIGLHAIDHGRGVEPHGSTLQSGPKDEVDGFTLVYVQAGNLGIVPIRCIEIKSQAPIRDNRRDGISVFIKGFDRKGSAYIGVSGGSDGRFELIVLPSGIRGDDQLSLSGGVLSSSPIRVVQIFETVILDKINSAQVYARGIIYRKAVLRVENRAVCVIDDREPQASIYENG